MTLQLDQDLQDAPSQDELVLGLGHLCVHPAECGPRRHLSEMPNPQASRRAGCSQGYAESSDRRDRLPFLPSQEVAREQRSHNRFTGVWFGSPPPGSAAQGFNQFRYVRSIQGIYEIAVAGMLDSATMPPPPEQAVEDLNRFRCVSKMQGILEIAMVDMHAAAISPSTPGPAAEGLNQFRCVC